MGMGIFISREKVILIARTCLRMTDFKPADISGAGCATADLMDGKV
jgi:hypothetical protein